VLRAALARFGKTAIVSTAFGPSGLALLHLAQTIDPQVCAYYIDTGFAFPETEALVTRWVSERGLNLKRVLPLLAPEEQAERYGEALWARDPDHCCRMRKVEPNQRALEGARLWIAALRRDESPSRAATPMLQKVKLHSGATILKLCPLVRWSQKDVWRYIAANDLPYNALHDRGYPSVGCTHCTQPVAEGGDERSGRWAGTAKKECGLHLTQDGR
jgi:phosphoadenosine phosphosulfate reductase